MSGKINDDPIAYLESAMFARKDKSGNALTELRCNIKRVTMDVIDAKALSESRESLSGGSKEVTRSEIINRILDDWARSQIDNARLILQLADINPTATESLNRRRKGDGND